MTRRRNRNTGLPVTPRVLPRDMAMTLRIVLDDQNYTALSAGVSALHAFIVPVDDGSSDQSYLSELKHGTVVLPPRVHLHRNGLAENKNHSHEVEEVVYIDTAEADDGTSISDEDLAALDPVQALLNMDLGTRLRYILETIQLPDQSATEKMLDILIAVARHSPRAAHEISSNARLLKLLQQQYIENEQVLTFQEDNIRSLQLSLKALELVRALCQGQRSVASALIASGLIQSTKGFLALKEVPSGDVDDEAAALFGRMQVESLRIWRILLGYGLDFHCFAYLFPALSGFMQHATAASTARNVALFAALETFCGLESVHEAQHYFNQWVSSWMPQNSFQLVASMLRSITWRLPGWSKSAASDRWIPPAIVANNLLADDMDDDDVVQTFSGQVKTPLLVAATSAVASSSAKFSSTLIQACELTLLLGELIATGQSDVVSFNANFVQNVYHQALILVERLGGGGEYLTARLFAGVLFHQRTLQMLGVFSEEADATRMSRVLIPIYQALVNATPEQEAHSAQIFSAFQVSTSSRAICVSPKRNKTTFPMKLIVSATCRFVFEFERLAPSMASIPSIAELRPEDKLFHLMHVFFAGSDVLFDDHVDAALRQLLPKLVKPILLSSDSRLLYQGILRNLKRFQSLESGEELEPPKNSSLSFSSDERQVLTFVEKLMAEFTASSFGNSHFAQCVTLLLTSDFPLELPVQAMHPRHIADAKTLQFMQQAVCMKQVSPARGAFAYSVAIHHIVVYLFAEGDASTMSFARQNFAQTHTTEASPSIWGHLLSYDAATNTALLREEHGSILPERVTKLRSQAAFSSDQRLAFEATVSLLENTK
ncbi:hypothetical protein GQ600_1967 [Phytophthora cactorum]|nr:hypothetical protein GQ600_1967 [Phytophthora cactorum]